MAKMYVLSTDLGIFAALLNIAFILTLNGRIPQIFGLACYTERASGRFAKNFEENSAY